MGRAKRERRERIRAGLEEPIAPRKSAKSLEQSEQSEASPFAPTAVAILGAFSVLGQGRPQQFKPNRKQRRNRK